MPSDSEGDSAEVAGPLCGESGSCPEADLNADGREDFVIKHWLGGNGTMYTFLCNVTFAISDGDGYAFTSTEGPWSGLSYFVDMNGDGICESIHTAFVQGRHITAREGRPDLPEMGVRQVEHPRRARPGPAEAPSVPLRAGTCR
jgi:hypothetical protein